MFPIELNVTLGHAHFGGGGILAVSIQSRVPNLTSLAQVVLKIDWLIDHGLTSLPTQYRLYGRRVVLKICSIVCQKL